MPAVDAPTIAPSIQIHEKFLPLLAAHRYKVAHGGRGGLKSWQFARALLYYAVLSQERILCTREVQKSLEDSVLQLLEDQIELLSLSDFFTVQADTIIGVNGSTFVFHGLSDLTVESIKSFEGVTKVWCEEARSITKRSWDILLPTIRRPGSEIWISFNPELDTDETYVRFVVNPPEDCVVIASSWRDNPWLSRELDMERRHCQATQSQEEYEWIWEGRCRPAEAGAIWSDEVALMQKEQRITLLPYDPMLRVHTVWDFGFNDAMAVLMCQRRMNELRIIDYLEVTQKSIPDVVPMLAEKRYNWGYDFLPHDGYTRDHKRGESTEDILKAFGRRPMPLNQANPKEAVGTIEQTIRAARPMLRQTYIDKGKGARLIECLKRFKRHIPKHGEPSTPIHDKYSHGAATVRYAPFAVGRMTNDIEHLEAVIPGPQRGARDRSLGGL